MTAARAAIGNYCFKQSVSKILRQCNWGNIDQMIKVSCLKCVHSLIRIIIPESTCKLLKFPRRPTAKITLIKCPEKEITRTLHIFHRINCTANCQIDLKNFL